MYRCAVCDSPAMAYCPCPFPQTNPPAPDETKDDRPLSFLGRKFIGSGEDADIVFQQESEPAFQ